MILSFFDGGCRVVSRATQVSSPRVVDNTLFAVAQRVVGPWDGRHELTWTWVCASARTRTDSILSHLFCCERVDCPWHFALPESQYVWPSTVMPGVRVVVRVVVGILVRILVEGCDSASDSM